MARLAVCILLLGILDITTAVTNDTAIDGGTLLETRTHNKSKEISFENARTDVNITTLISNTAIDEKNLLETRRRKKSRETSSSEDARSDDSESSDKESLGISTESRTSASENKPKKHRPKSTEERKGWRKWHRKCTKCPEDMRKKWRDPTIQWVCGGYQRARRSFKSTCMMHYRNCQDGTMFVKLHDRRCENSSAVKPHGDHFFYEYPVFLSDESDSRSDSSSSETSDL